MRTTLNDVVVEPVTTRRARAPIADEFPLNQVSDIPVSQIKPGDNDRTLFDQAELMSLADNIRTTTLASPITVRPIQPQDGIKYEIVAGERRYRAVLILQWPTIPALVRELTDEQAAAIMLSENVHRLDIDPIDEANAYKKRMNQFQWTLNEIADKVKKDPRHITARLMLLELLPEAQTMIRSKQISVAFGDLMAPLNQERQKVALKYLSDTDHPVLRVFRILVGKLLAEQAQDDKFRDTDLAQYARQIIAESIDERKGRRADQFIRRFPIDPRMPPMKKDGGLGESFDAYIASLLVSDDRYLKETAAPIVGAIFDSMLREGLALPGKQRHLKELQSKKKGK